MTTPGAAVCRVSPPVNRLRGPVRLRVGRVPAAGLPRGSRTARACSSPPRPVQARRLSESSLCTWRSRQAVNALHHADRTVTPKYTDLVRRYGRPRSACHRRQQRQRRGTGGGDDHRRLPEHALCGFGSLTGLGYVVLDEVHYFSDRFRGAVWEEVIIHLPQNSVQVVALSATVEQCRGVRRVARAGPRGDTTVIVDEHRPVPTVAAHARQRAPLRPVHRRRCSRRSRW